MPVEPAGHGLAGDQLEEVADERLDLEVRHGARLGRGDVRRVSEREDGRVFGRLQRMRVHRHVVQLVAQPRSCDELGAHVERDGDQQVEWHLPPVVGHQHPPIVIDSFDEEVGLDQDLAFVQHRAEVVRGDGPGESSRRAA